jgi:D-glycero-D-manno-heptose 1,7-bisphosphate phosphatase
MGLGCLSSSLVWALHLTSSTVAPLPPTILDDTPHRRAPPLVLLDRDGVINEDVGSPGVLSVSQLALTPDAGYAIGRLKKRPGGGCSVVMVTNQSSVGKGLLSPDELREIQQRVQELLWAQDEEATIDRIYQCTSNDPHHPRRKPNPGMVQEALHDFSGSDCSTLGLRRKNIYFIGDTSTDLQAAAAGGVQHRILVSTGYGRTLMTPRATNDDDNNNSSEDPTMVDRPSSSLLPLWIHNVVEDYPAMDPCTPVPFLYCQNLAQAIAYILEQEEQFY